MPLHGEPGECGKRAGGGALQCRLHTPLTTSTSILAFLKISGKHHIALLSCRSTVTRYGVIKPAARQGPVVERSRVLNAIHIVYECA